MKKTLTKGLERQDEFLQSIQGADFDFGLVFTQAFLKGIRDIGYKSTATALFESFDNAIQAEASQIHLLFDWDKGKTGKKEPDRIAIVDDGHGMKPEMIRIAVLWGGSDRLDNRDGMGKYGYGLPSSCVSIGQRFTVISKREDMVDWYSVTIDIEEIGSRNPEYYDPQTGRIIAPIPKVSKVPDFIRKYLKEHEKNLTSGTIIMIEKIDRLSKVNFGALKKMLTQETGVTYRNYLRQTQVFIDGIEVEPIDPLFITEGYRYYEENDSKAVPFPSNEITVTSVSDKSKTGTIKIRYSYMPYGFFNLPKNNNDETNEEPSDSSDSEDENKKNKRFPIRKGNNGFIFLRKGRQIDVVDSKCPWTKIQNNDRYVGVDIDFSPELDEDFSITTSKQQIVVSERIWNILRDNGVYEQYTQLRKKYDKQAKEEQQKKENAINSSPEKRDEFVEGLMEESAKDFEVDKESIPPQVKKEGGENLEKQAKKIAKETGLPESLIKQELEANAENKPFRLDYFDEPEGPFYRSEQVGSQVVIYLNKSHRFYIDLFNNPKTSAFQKNALALLVFVLGHSEIRVQEEKRKWYKIERNIWSMKLDSTLETLSKHFAKSLDDEIFEEEIRDSSPNKS